jgi:hypothetical protein
MRRAVGVFLVTLVAAVAFIGAAAGAGERSANCAGYCLYTPSAGGWSFDGQFGARESAEVAKPWLRLSNSVRWKLTLGSRFSGTRVTGEIHLGTPGRPGRLLAVLCARCRSGSHGMFRLSDETLGLIFAGTRLGSFLPVRAVVVLRTSHETLRRQLRDG